MKQTLPTLPPNVVTAGGLFYKLTDPCLECGHCFECTSEGKAKAGCYPQMSTINLRYCIKCSSLQEWKLTGEQQPYNHIIDPELNKENKYE